MRGSRSTFTRSRRRPEPGDIKPGTLHSFRFTCFFDGCCEPVNPGGTGGLGAVIFDRKMPLRVKGGTDAHLGGRVFELSKLIPPAPETSNNVVEYLAVNAIFDWFVERGLTQETVQIFGDSRLIINQLWGPPSGKLWKIHGVDTQLIPPKKPGFYAPHAVAAREKLKIFRNCLGFWIPRKENSIADELSKAELKRAGVEFRIQPEDEEHAA